MASRVDGIHVLIDPIRVPPERLATFIAAIADGGAQVVQIRIKDGDDAAGRRYTADAVRLARQHHLVSIVNDRLDWALAVGADGVHLGQEDTPLTVARAKAPAPFLIGASAGTAQELASAVHAGADYVGIGPVYTTQSKTDAGQPLGPSGFAKLAALAAQAAPPLPGIAIGGIEPANASRVWVAGASGIAVIRAVTEALDPKAAVAALLAGRRSDLPR